MPFSRWVNLAALGAVIIWGGVPTATKFALRDFQPTALVVLRLIITSLLLIFLLALMEKNRGIDKGDIPLLVLAGVVATGVFQILFAVGLDRTTASNTAVIMTTAPIFTALVAGATRQEGLSPLTLLGTLAAFVGVVLLVQGQGLQLGLENLLGDILVLAAAFAWALYPIAAAPLLRRYSVLKVTTYGTALAAGAILPATLSDLLRQNWGAVTPEAWMGALYFIFFGGLISWWLWGRGIRQLGPTQTMVYYYFQPLVGVSLAVLLLLERLNLVQVAGIGVLFLGVGMARKW